MSSTDYIVYNIVPLGFLILLIYIFLDIFLDYFRSSKRDNLQRVLLYSFLFYVLSVIQIKFGGITLPPQNPSDSASNFIFKDDWFGIFNTMYYKISVVWNYSAIFYNVVLFVPLGIYLLVFFNLKSNKKAYFFVVLSCIVIEILRFLLNELGLVTRGANIHIFSNMLINIVGGIVGFVFAGFTLKMVKSNRHKVKILN